ncbi:MAG: iron ABC transporter [Candidatus Latescibacteria bacterium]|nr:iron ABC transporter [Candidatus Latescibacterota bacterium]
MLGGSFWIILTGAFAGGACGLLGVFLVLRKMSLLGDALSHAVLPGIAIAFLVSGSRDILPMFLGAAVFGVMTTLLVETFHRRWHVQEDASIGIAFTSLFALGVVLISAYAGQVDLDQECVLYGEIAYTPWDRLLIGEQDWGPRPVWILGTVFVLDLLFVLLFYKELKITSFDPDIAVAVGIPATLMHYMLMSSVSLTTVAAFESVGAILVVAMLIVPGATAYLWSDRLPVILIMSTVFGIVSAIAGYYLAGLWNSSIAGAMVLVVGGIFGVSLIVAPQYGLLGRVIRQGRLGLRVAQDHILLRLVRESETTEDPSVHISDLMEGSVGARFRSRVAMWCLGREGFVTWDAGHLALSDNGLGKATDLLRSHRLWETYFSQLGLPEDHLHHPADALEHFTDEELLQGLHAELPNAEIDPQGKRIPKNK